MLRAGFCVALGLCVLVAGCGRPQAGWGVREISRDKTTVGGENIPGLDAYHISMGTYGDRAAVVVWADAPLFDLSADHTAEGHHYVGRLDGSKYDPLVECTTTDGITGKVTIGATTYALQDGPLFLVRHADGEPVVAALHRKLDPEMTLEAAEELATNDVEIRQFFLQAE